MMVSITDINHEQRVGWSHKGENMGAYTEKDYEAEDWLIEENWKEENLQGQVGWSSALGNPTNKPDLSKPEVVIGPDHIEFVKRNESLHKQEGEDVEGEGILTYGYGARDVLGKFDISDLNSAEYQAWSDSTLTSNLHDSFRIARQSFSNNYSGAPLNDAGYTTDYTTFDSLPYDAKMILTDFAFQGIDLRSYPNMVTALRDGDWDTVAKEYKRTLRGKELTKRNLDTYNTYIKHHVRGEGSSELNNIKSDNSVFDTMVKSTKDLFGF